MVRKLEQQLKVAQIILQHLDFDGSFFTTWYYKHGIKKLPNHWWTRGYHFHDTIGYHSNNMIAILGQVKKLMYMGFWAILNFQNFKVALNPMYRSFSRETCKQLRVSAEQ